MVDSETIETKISDKKEEDEEEIKVDEKKDRRDERKERFEARKEKGKTITDNVINEISTGIDEFKEYLKGVQKNADKKYTEYKQTTVQPLDADYVETNDTYYIKAAVPGVPKDEIIIEAGDNDITIEVTVKPYIEEFDEEDEAELISSSIKSGRCVKTIRFENSIEIDKISAKFLNGIVYITIPKLIIPKHKVNVE